MQFTINANDPNDLLRATLKTLAEFFGGYKDGNDFLELWDDLIQTGDLDLASNALVAVRQLANQVHGAATAFALRDIAEEAIQSDGLGDEPDVEDPTIGFVDPTEADFAALGRGAFGQEGQVFYLTPTRFPDFGVGKDPVMALNGFAALRPSQETAFELPPAAQAFFKALLGADVSTFRKA